MKAQTKKIRQNKRNNASKLITNIKLYGGICNRIKTMATKAEERKVVSIENAMITDVTSAEIYENGSERRIEIHTDKQFERYNKKNELVISDKFSKDYSEVCKVINHPLFKLIKIEAVGKVIAPQTFSLFLFGAEISFDNLYYKKGETRNERIFEKDTIVTEITNVILHLDPICEERIREKIKDGSVYIDPRKKQTTQVVNFYNV